MSIYDSPELLAAASQNAYLDEGTYQVLSNAGFERQDDDAYYNEATDFEAAVWYNSSTNEYIVAYRGTELSVQDAYADLQYGWPQFVSQESQNLLSFIEGIGESNPQAQIHFTGHSLGGALAQYSAYALLERGSQPRNR